LFTALLFAMGPNEPDIRRMMEMEGLNHWVLAEGAGLDGYQILFDALEDQNLWLPTDAV